MKKRQKIWIVVLLTLLAAAAVFFALYIWYVCKIYCDAATRGKTVMYLGSAFLCFYGFVALVALLSGVTA